MGNRIMAMAHQCLPLLLQVSAPTKFRLETDAIHSSRTATTICRYDFNGVINEGADGLLLRFDRKVESTREKVADCRVACSLVHTKKVFAGIEISRRSDGANQILFGDFQVKHIAHHTT